MRQIKRLTVPAYGLAKKLDPESLSDDDEEAVEAEGDEPLSETSELVQEVAVDEAAPERA